MLFRIEKWKTLLDRAPLHLKFLKNCDMFLLWVRLWGADDWQTKTNKFTVKFSRIFRWRRALSSKVFHLFHVAKCYSELKNEELSWKKLTPKLFGKLTYYRLHQSLTSPCSKMLFWTTREIGHPRVLHIAASMVNVRDPFATIVSAWRCRRVRRARSSSSAFTCTYVFSHIHIWCNALASKWW